MPGKIIFQNPWHIIYFYRPKNSAPKTFSFSIGYLSQNKAMPSTVIELFHYDNHTATLKIVFRSGNIYAYKNVPESVYQDLKIAGSKGGYFNHYIKNIYPFEHLQKAAQS